jgi:hypothetical protein
LQFRTAIYFYGLSPFFSKQILRLLRLAAGVSENAISRLETDPKGYYGMTDQIALHDASEVYRKLNLTWIQALPLVEKKVVTENPRTASKAPPPPHALSGTGGSVASQPEPVELPRSFPPDFPKSETAVDVKRDAQTLSLSNEGAHSPQSAAQHANKETAQASAPRFNWQDIELVFLSDERVQIFRKKKAAETLNYAEFGLQDLRTDTPNFAWNALRVIAEKNGTIRNRSEAGSEWSVFEKRIQEIRKVLRKHFGIPADPIPFVEGGGYVAQFKIRCGKSYRR